MNTNIFITGAYKLEVLSCMYEALRESVPGCYSLPEAKDFDAVDRTYRKLQGMSAHDFMTGRVDEEPLTLSLMLRGGKDSHTFTFTDAARNARVFVFVVDTPLLMAGKLDIKPELTKTLEDVKGKALVLLVPVKCEAYSREEITSALSGLTTLMRGRCAGVVVPVQTFSHAGFTPKNHAQIMKVITSFLRGQGTLKTSPGNTALIDESEVHVLCGHELLKPEAPKTSRTVLKVFAAAAVVCVIAGVGLWQYRRAKLRAYEYEQSVQAYEQSAIGFQEDVSAAKSAEAKALRELSRALRERDEARRERDVAVKTADRLQKENDQLRAELEEAHRNKPKKDGFLSGALKKIGL